jgi:hypothetical protein
MMPACMFPLWLVDVIPLRPKDMQERNVRRTILLLPFMTVANPYRVTTRNGLVCVTILKIQLWTDHI